MTSPHPASAPPLPCACASLRRAARAVTQLYDELIKDTGLTTPQFTLLQVLAQVGSITQGGLGAILAIDSTTLTRTLRPLLKQGWIRSRAGDDQRERHLSLTGPGKSRLEAALPAWNLAQERLRAELGNLDWNSLLVALARVTQAARQA